MMFRKETQRSTSSTPDLNHSSMRKQSQYVHPLSPFTYSITGTIHPCTLVTQSTREQTVVSDESDHRSGSAQRASFGATMIPLPTNLYYSDWPVEESEVWCKSDEAVGDAQNCNTQRRSQQMPAVTGKRLSQWSLVLVFDR